MTALMIKSGLIILQDFKDSLPSCLAAREWQGIDSAVIQMLIFNYLQVNKIILLTCKKLKISIFSNNSLAVQNLTGISLSLFPIVIFVKMSTLRIITCHPTKGKMSFVLCQQY